jgi:hypothetical protein
LGEKLRDLHFDVPDREDLELVEEYGEFKLEVSWLVRSRPQMQH